MATTAIRDTAVVTANENRGESKVRSIFNAIAHVLKPYFGLRNLDLLDSENRSKLAEREKGIINAYFNCVGHF